MPPFFRRPTWHMSLCGTGCGTSVLGGGGGGLAAHKGGMDMETPAGKTRVPHPRTYWFRVLDAS